MTPLTKGIAVALLQLAIVGSLGGKLLLDRIQRPRVWVRAASLDPELPIRGRYLTLRLEVKAPWFHPLKQFESSSVRLGAENGTLVAYKSDLPTDLTISQGGTRGRDIPVYLDDAVDFFLPEHATLPAIVHGEEIWVEVTVPRKGPPRPIQLAIKNGSVWMPMNYR
jgi:hypothetical protein